MNDESSVEPGQGRGTTMYRPSVDGGLEAATESVADYRDQLRSSRWNAAPLENSEVEKSDPRLVVLGVVVLSAITLVILILGYGSGFWG